MEADKVLQMTKKLATALKRPEFIRMMAGDMLSLPGFVSQSTKFYHEQITSGEQFSKYDHSGVGDPDLRRPQAAATMAREMRKPWGYDMI